jgi:hypothetical protein
VLLVKRGELDEHKAIGSFETVGKFSTTREVKDYAWNYCHQSGRPSLYLCYTLGHLKTPLHAIIALSKENGCVRLREETLSSKSGELRSLEFILKRFLAAESTA